MATPKEKAIQAAGSALVASPSFLERFVKDLNKETGSRIKDAEKIVIEFDKKQRERIELHYSFGKLETVSVYFAGKLSFSQKV